MIANLQRNVKQIYPLSTGGFFSLRAVIFSSPWLKRGDSKMGRVEDEPEIGEK
jgi:hypothetical protein